MSTDNMFDAETVMNAVQRSHEVTSVAKRIAGNVVLKVLPHCDEYRLAFDPPFPTFDEDYSEGPEAWTIMGRITGYDGSIDDRKICLEVNVTFGVSLVKNFDELVASDSDAPRHQDTAFVGIVDRRKHGKKVTSAYLRVELPTILNGGKYKYRKADTGLDPHFRDDDFAPVEVGNGFIEMPEAVRQAHEDANGAGS